MLRMPAEPILASPVTTLVVPLTWIAEPKWDGFRALVAHRADGRVLLRSRRGTDMTAAFPEIAAAAAAQLPEEVLLDGELVVWEKDRLAFERLVQRMNRRGPAAARLAVESPAHFVVFDLLHHGATLQNRPYAERRAALEDLFATQRLGPPWTLCPKTAVTDLDTIRTWLSWSVAGVEGLVLKDPAQKYLPGVRAWRKYRVRATTEAVVAAVTGTTARPGSILLGRFDAAGELRFTGRTGPLSERMAQNVAALLRPAGSSHPWRGRKFSAGWGTREVLDAAGRWRHPVRLLRIRVDMAPGDAPHFGAGNEPAGG